MTDFAQAALPPPNSDLSSSLRAGERGQAGAPSDLGRGGVSARELFEQIDGDAYLLGTGEIDGMTGCGSIQTATRQLRLEYEALNEVVRTALEITWFECAGPGTPLHDAKLAIKGALSNLEAARKGASA